MDFTTHPGRRDTMLAVLLYALAALYLVTGMASMLWLSPKVPYADPWRFLASLASLPFPQDVLHADNGHREVLPNALRLLELRWFDANQWLQVLVGAMLAAATAVALARILLQAPARPLRLAAAACAAAMMLFWLGSERTLAHGNESVHAYLITLCLVAGLALMRRPTIGRATAAALLGLVATFSFGAGIACFAAFAMAAWLQRATSGAWAALLAGGVLSIGLYLGGAVLPSSLQFDLPVQAERGLRWLAAPFLYLAWPAIDPQVAMQVPTATGRAMAMGLADGWQAVFGPARLARWPWMGIGLAGVVLWLLLLRRSRRAEPGQADASMPGLGIATFGLAVGALVMAGRSDYFSANPEQLLAPRYMVWPTLFWGGLLLAWLGATARVGRTAMVIALAAIVALPSQAWMARLAWTTRGVAEQVALGAAVGVLATSEPTGETNFDELVLSLPLLQARRTSIYAWPETQALGQVLAQDEGAAVASTRWRITPVANRLGDGTGARVAFEAQAAAARIAVVDDEGRVRGIAMRDRAAGGDHWRGWIRGPAAGTALRAFVLDNN